MMLAELLALFREVYETCAWLGRKTGQRLFQPVLTALCVTLAYASIHITREGSLTEGVRVAFLDSEADRSERRRLEEQTAMQTELRQFAAANRLIDQLLLSMLGRASGAARVRLNVIHNGVSGLTGTGLLRYDVTNTVAAPGRASGAAVVNQPLSEWSDFLPTLLGGQCAMIKISAMRSISLRAQFEGFGASNFLVCPAADVQGKTVGGVFIFWDGAEPVPEGDDLRRLMADGLRLGAQIAAILDLRGPAPFTVND